MSLIVKIALTSFLTGIMLMLVSLIVGLFDDFDYDRISFRIFMVGVLLAGIPFIGLLFYCIGHVFIVIWTYGE